MKGLKAHEAWRGKLRIASVPTIESMADLTLAYTPGVAEASLAIVNDPSRTNALTWRGRLVGVISDGSAVLGLGNIGPDAALPVMEGKCVLFKRFADLDAIPLVLDTQDPEAFIRTVVHLAPSLGAINLEDIKAPECVHIERTLKKLLSIPVFHDDQHGTAIVVLAGLINALTVVQKAREDVKVVLSGLGAAGSAITKLLAASGFKHLVGFDVLGKLHPNRVTNALEEELVSYLERSNPTQSLQEALIDADVFIGVSAGNILNAKDIQAMNEGAIVFALANPTPEISYQEAHEAGAAVVATGRSDAPNQINNVLAFPGLIRAALMLELSQFDEQHYLKAAHAIAALVDRPTPTHIVPTVFDERLTQALYEALKNT